jgi:hypothetical protein
MSERPAALARLDALVGSWAVGGPHPADPSTQVRGTEEIEWIEGGKFLRVRSTAEPEEFPNGLSIIGCDAAHDTYSVLYSDDRGVFRLYEMSFDGSVWEQRRDATDPFPQRFVGELSDDGNTIEARWEKAPDGSNWELDFHLTYTKEG